MVECIVTLCGGGISVHVPVLLDVEAVDAETMPSRFTGWLKRSFQETDIHRLLSSDGAKVLSVFEGRFSYILEIEDERSLRFVGTRIHDKVLEQSTAGT